MQAARLYRFMDLAHGIQRKLAHEWAQIAEDVVDIDTDPSTFTEEYALQCLQSDLAFKYLPNGTEV